MNQSTWPGGYRHAMHQSDHEAWNAKNYPGTRQLCADCGEPTGRCEDDSIYADDDREIGPLCEKCRELRINPMKVIFLDVDGVLSSGGAEGLCGTRLDLFAKVIREAPARVVLSSLWRHPHCTEQRMLLQRELRRRGVELHSKTPIGPKGRANEIRAWLAQQEPGSIADFVVLDDDPSEELAGLKDHLVICTSHDGLTEDIARQLIARLNRT